MKCPLAHPFFRSNSGSPPGVAAPELVLARAGRTEGRGVLFLLILLLLCLPAFAHDVKDPVCRMNTDTDTTPYRETVGGKTYYFCSLACQSRFDRAPAAYLTLAQRLLSGHRTYSLTLDTPIRAFAGRPVALTFGIHETPTGDLVREFEVVHEKPLHLILVSADFGWFEHQHPAPSADGRFRLAWTFPRSGRYFLYTDFTPTDGDNQILRATLDVGGTAEKLRRSPVLIADVGAVKTSGDTRITLKCRPLTLRAGQAMVLTYTFSDVSGRPRTDLQPIMGVMGHLIALREDGTTIVHTHALHGVHSGSYGAAMLAMMQAGQREIVPITAEMVTERGPCFSFKLTLPKPGHYRVWAQFQRKNQWLTVPYTVEIKP